MLSWVFFVFLIAGSGHVFGQTIFWLDAQGNPATVFLEGSRAYLRVTDPAANTDPATIETVTVAVSAAHSGDAETVTLTETGPATGAFTGSIQLALNGGSGDGLLRTALDLNGSSWFDTLTATYGSATASAGTVGSTTEIIDAQGAVASTFPIDNRIYLRVRDALADTTPGADTTTVNVGASTNNNFDFEIVTLTETGGATGIFEGSLATSSTASAVQQDGVLKVLAGVEVGAWHNDANGATASPASAIATSPSLPVSVAIVDENDQPLVLAYQRSMVYFRAVDTAAAGTGSLLAQASSLLRGDQHWVSLQEDGSHPGTFRGSIYLDPQPMTGSFSYTGLTVTEDPGPPHRDDTVRVTLSCQTPPCATASVPAIASTLRFLDAQGQPLTRISVGAPLTIEGMDNSAVSMSVTNPPSMTVTLTAQPGGDTETVYLQYVSGYPYHTTFRATLPTAGGTVQPGNSRLELPDGGTLTANHSNLLGSVTTLSAPTGSILLQFLDGQGNPTAEVWEYGQVRVRAVVPTSSLDPNTADTLTAAIVTKDVNGAVRDSETLLLTETGPNTGTFLGQITLSPTSPTSSGNGTLESWSTQHRDLDHVVVSIAAVESTATVVAARIWLLTATGTNATEYTVGQPVRVRIEAQGTNFNPNQVEQRAVRLTSLTTGDVEYFLLNETGVSTGIFEGSIPTGLGGPVFGRLDVQPGESIVAQDYYSFAVDVTAQALMVSGPPLPQNDFFSLLEDQTATLSVLDNDVPPGGSPLTVIGIPVQPLHGTAALSGNLIVYTPAPNYNGSDQLHYTVRNASGQTAEANVDLYVQPVDDAPLPQNDTATMAEDTQIYIGVLANDVDPDGLGLVIKSVSQPAHGSVWWQPEGTLYYTPQANYNGPDSFTYTAGHSAVNAPTSTATVRITVTPVNDPPVAVTDSATTPEDTPVTISVLTNDTDVDGDSLTVTAVTQPAHGSASYTATNVTYTPAANYNGPDSFTYSISDGHGGSATGAVSVNVTPVNDPPVAVADSVTTAEDTAVTINVLANDSDVEGELLSITNVTPPAHGSVSYSSFSVTYTPAANYNGPDSFTYTISDGHGFGSLATATVTLTVTPVNDAPVAVTDQFTTNEDTPLVLNVLANDHDVDGDTLTIISITQPNHGSSATFTSSAITYTPGANYNGPDSLQYTLSDGNGGTATGYVWLTVNPVNDAPIASPDSSTTSEDTAVSISVLTNDTDVDGDSLTVTAVTQPAHGAATYTATGVTYNPAANYNGPDSFTYSISDGHGGTATGTVSITVTAVNDPPVAVANSATTAEDTPVTIGVLANDTDVDGDTLTVTAVTQPAHGAVSFTASGVTYSPAANYNGSDSFTYSISDGHGGTASATVSMTITAVNDPPIAGADSTTTREGVAVTLSVLANDSDIEGSALTVAGVSTPAHGTASFTSSSVTYTPANNFNGIETFTYTVSDGAITSTGTITVTVKDALERVAVLATNSVWIQTGADVLSGDVVVNQAGAGPFLNGAELSLAGTVTTPSGWDLDADSLTIAAGTTVASDVFFNQLTNSGTITGQQTSSLALPVFATLPAFLTATPNTTDVTVANNGTRTLAAGTYRDLVIGKKATVTFTGGVYHFRSIRTSDIQAKLLFSAASTVRVQQTFKTLGTTTIGPASGASITASGIVFYIGGINGTGGGITETPKAVEIGTDNVLTANIYAPNGTLWLADRTQARGSFIGKDVLVGPDVQVTLQTAWTGQ